jgi:hypothetical protein
MRFRLEENSYLPKRLQKKGASFYFVYKENERINWISLGKDFDFVVNKWKELTAKVEPDFDYSGINFDQIKKHRTIRFKEKDLDKNVERTFKRAKKGAEDRGIEFLLSVDDLRYLYSRANGRCELTGITFCYEPIEGKSARPWIPSIDRIDNAKGYSKENCRIVCHAVNMALNQFGDDVLFKIAQNLMKKSYVLEASL